MHSIILDRTKDSVIPDGYKLIETESEFLAYANSGKKLFVRGSSLCNWAQNFFDGRKIPYAEAISPISKLVETYVGLTAEHAKSICNLLGAKTSYLISYAPAEILGACFPISLWDTAPSKTHAAEWLLWLDDQKPSEEFQPILKVMSASWKQADPTLAEIYNIDDAVAAKAILLKWLGSQITPFIDEMGAFPIPIPDKWIETLDKDWRSEIVKSKGVFLSTFVKTPLEWRFKQMVAMATLDYFEKHTDADEFTLEVYDLISRFVSGKDRARLRKIKPVPVPGDIPENPDLVGKWFAGEYLPFREWQVATNATKLLPQVMELGKQFALWYLDYYPKALISKKNLSFFRSKALKDHDHAHVNLLIVLDGLHAVDAKYLVNELLKSNGSQHLSVIESSYCFAPLPTVTDFAKGALVHGVQPTFMKEFALLGTDVSEQQTPVPKLQTATPGALFIWRIQDPDHTYHTKNKSAMLTEEIEGELSTIAQKVIDVAEKVSSKIPLRIVITTDHGRYLGESKRTVDIPEKMEAHGRAAWGKTEIVYDKTGFHIDNDVVYLSKDRFGLLDHDAAVILTDCAFKNDKYDKELYTHGGLFPEEVIIPWIVLERNVTKPRLDTSVTGQGRANRPGKLEVAIINSGSIDVVIRKAEIILGAENRYVHEIGPELKALSKIEFDLSLPSWPSGEQKAHGKVVFTVCLPDGDEFEIENGLDKLEIVELYSRDNTLLEGFDLP